MAAYHSRPQGLPSAALPPLSTGSASSYPTETSSSMPSATSPSADSPLSTNSDSLKREHSSSDDVRRRSGGKRVTRTRPVANACSSCRRAKVKCCGKHPICDRCRARGVACQYDVSEEGISKLQDLRQKFASQKDQLDRTKAILDVLQRSPDEVAANVLARLRIGDSIHQLSSEILGIPHDGQFTVPASLTPAASIDTQTDSQDDRSSRTSSSRTEGSQHGWSQAAPTAPMSRPSSSSDSKSRAKSTSSSSSAPAGRKLPTWSGNPYQVDQTSASDRTVRPSSRSNGGGSNASGSSRGAERMEKTWP